MAVRPVTGRCALGCSTFKPSISQRYCCGVISQKTVTFPDQGFNPVRTPPAEKKDGPAAERIKIKPFFYDSGQPIDPIAEIRIAAGNVYLLRAGKVT